MREKREYIILTFRTTTAAMAMERWCGQEGIPGRIIPLPASISAGCGLSWRMLPLEYEKWERIIRELNIPYQSVCRVYMR